MQFLYTWSDSPPPPSHTVVQKILSRPPPPPLFQENLIYFSYMGLITTFLLPESSGTSRRWQPECFLGVTATPRCLFKGTVPRNFKSLLFVITLMFLPFRLAQYCDIFCLCLFLWNYPLILNFLPDLHFCRVSEATISVQPWKCFQKPPFPMKNYI